MARGQGWEPGEEAETDLEQGAETGRQAAWGERRETELTSEPRDRRQDGGREGASVCHDTNIASHALTPTTAITASNLTCYGSSIKFLST